MPRITKTSLDRYSNLQAEATELARRARALQAEAKSIESAAKADLVASGKEAISRGGYRIEWTTGRLSVSWKDEFVGRLGADIANEITKAATPPRVVRITPPAAVAQAATAAA